MLVLALGIVAGFAMLDPMGAAMGVEPGPAGGERVVADSERGLVFGQPYDGDWSRVGIYLGLPIYVDTFKAMAPEAIKISQGRFQHFSLADNRQYAYFPVDQLREYEAREVAAGRPPLFVTTTHEGRKRQVYFVWSLGTGARTGGAPGAPAAEWMQAVNVADERFIQFWIHEYARKVLRAAGLPNTWIGLDNCAFQYDLYGVLDRTNRLARGVRWDRPFAQDEGQLLESVKHFFRRVKEIAPDLRLICNAGEPTDPARFRDVYADIGGIVEEDLLYHYKPSDRSRQEIYRRHLNAAWLASTGKVGLLSFHTMPRDETLGDRLRTAYVHYLILRGANFFFAPQFDVPEVSPALYGEMRAALGLPIGPATSEPMAGKGDGHRLYSRPTEGGVVFLNWSGATRTIDLPADRPHYDRYGRAITRLTVPDMTGDYVVFAPGPRVARPAISPRGRPPERGPVAVRLSSATPGARIFYTTDGSEPTTASPRYTRPLSLVRTTRVQARAVLPGRLDSFVSAASFVLTD
ncbi:MAG: chitobiase/beta-hexosaminidase C-terminal domain-containing protein [Candidatus Rokuibacteriota bacterium]